LLAKLLPHSLVLCQHLPLRHWLFSFCHKLIEAVLKTEKKLPMRWPVLFLPQKTEKLDPGTHQLDPGTGA
jgi:hypothetical protein